MIWRINIENMYIDKYYLPEIGNSQARLSELASFLRSNGNDVTILTAMPNYPTGEIFPNYDKIFSTEKIDKISIIRSFIYASKSIKKIPRLLNYFSFVISSFIIGLWKLSRQDIIFVESPPLFLGISGLLLSKIKKAKLIFNVSDLWPESALHLGIIDKGIIYNIAENLEYIFYKNAWLVTGQSEGIIKNINDRFPTIKTFTFLMELILKSIKEDLNRMSYLI